MSQVTAAPIRPNLLVALDGSERIFALSLFAYFTSRMSNDIIFRQSLGHILILASELLIVFFVVFRKHPVWMSLSPVDWFVAAAATSMPLLISPGASEPIAPEGLCSALICFGICFQISAKIALNRSFSIVPTNRGIKTRGPYAFIRHPIYMGYTITHIGYLLFAPDLWNLSVYSLGFILQIIRIFREERLLIQDKAYQEFSKAVRYRLIPGIF